jgi:hypothetical protein
LVYFSPFWYVLPRKIWQPWSSSWRQHQPMTQFFSPITHFRGLVSSNRNFRWFFPILGEKIGVFQKTMLWAKICIIKLCFESKTPIFCNFFSENNIVHNIGPWTLIYWQKYCSSYIYSDFAVVLLLPTVPAGNELLIVCSRDDWCDHSIHQACTYMPRYLLLKTIV